MEMGHPLPSDSMFIFTGEKATSIASQTRAARSGDVIV